MQRHELLESRDLSPDRHLQTFTGHVTQLLSKVLFLSDAAKYADNKCHMHLLFIEEAMCCN